MLSSRRAVGLNPTVVIYENNTTFTCAASTIQPSAATSRTLWRLSLLLMQYRFVLFAILFCVNCICSDKSFIMVGWMWCYFHKYWALPQIVRKSAIPQIAELVFLADIRSWFLPQAFADLRKKKIKISRKSANHWCLWAVVKNFLVIYFLQLFTSCIDANILWWQSWFCQHSWLG